MVLWRLYYADGLAWQGVDRGQAAAAAAPAFGVQALVQLCPEQGKHVLSHCDYYWHDGERWAGGDFVGLVDALAHKGPLVVRFGRQIPPAQFDAVMRRAAADPDFEGGGVWSVERGRGE